MPIIFVHFFVIEVLPPLNSHPDDGWSQAGKAKKMQ